MVSADPERLPTLISTAASVAAHAAIGLTVLLSPLLPRELTEPPRPREQPVQVRLVTPLAQVNDSPPPKPTPRPPPRDDAPRPPPPPEAATAEPPPPPTDEVVRFDQTDTTLGAQAEGTERLPDPSKGLSEASVRPDGQADAVRLGNTLATDAEGTASGDRFTSVPFSGAARPPRLVAKAPFVAPPAALARQIEGDVVLALTVSATGAVTSARLVRGLADDVDQACRDNALTSRWTPGARAAGAVTVTDVPFTCRLQRNLED
jgi:outer membrane biosynthesis protein TonB